MFRLSERFSLTAPHRTGLAVFPHPALQQEIRSVSACQIDVRPLQRVYFHDLLEFRPCQPAGLVSSSLCLEEFPFDIAVEFLQAYPVAIDSVIAIMPYEFLIQGLNRITELYHFTLSHYGVPALWPTLRHHCWPLASQGLDTGGLLGLTGLGSHQLYAQHRTGAHLLMFIIINKLLVLSRITNIIEPGRNALLSYKVE